MNRGRTSIWLIGVVLLTAGCKDSTPESGRPDAQAASCPGDTVTSCPASVPSYAKDVIPIVHARCAVCHFANNDAGHWPLDDYKTVFDWKDSILGYVRDCSQPPPDSGIALSASERITLEAWLFCGAPNN
jgi:hypothetical protein